MLQTHLKVALHCTKPLPFIYFHGKNVSDQPSAKVLKPIKLLFLNKRLRCNKMLLFYLSLPFYIKNSNFLYWMVPHHTEIYPDKILRCKNWYFWYNWKKRDFVFFGNVSITYNINECVHKINCINFTLLILRYAQF